MLPILRKSRIRRGAIVLIVALAALYSSAFPKLVCAWHLNQAALANSKLASGQPNLLQTNADPLLDPWRSIAEDRCSERASYQLGLHYYLVGQSSQALEAFRRAYRKGSNDSLVSFWQGTLLDTLGRTEEALSAWGHGGVAPYFVASGQAALRKSDLDTAESEFRRSIAIDANNLSAYLGLATTFRLERAWLQAADMYEHALVISPDNLDGNYHLGVVSLEAGDIVKARRYAVRVTTLYPSYVWGYILLGDTYRLEHAYDIAAHWYRSALKFAAQREISYRNLGINAYDQGDYGGAVEYFERALEVSPPATKGEIHFWLGQVYEKELRYDEAKREYDAATQPGD